MLDPILLGQLAAELNIKVAAQSKKLSAFVKQKARSGRIIKGTDNMKKHLNMAGQTSASSKTVFPFAKGHKING